MNRRNPFALIGSLIASLVSQMPGVFAQAHAPQLGFVGQQGSRRSRIPNSNAKHRFRHGIPHGVPGAKLARKALKARVGLSHP